MKLMTMRQFSEAEPAFSVKSLEYIRFRSKDKNDPFSKFAGAFVSVGHRVLIRPDKFLAIACGE